MSKNKYRFRSGATIATLLELLILAAPCPARDLTMTPFP
jgi:hypothetical protein